MDSLQAGHLWTAWAMAMPLLLLYLWLGRRRWAGRLLAVACFSAYLVVVAGFTLLPLRFDEAYRSQPPFDPAIVLAPFFLGDPAAVMTPTQYAGNVILGIPFGLLVPAIWHVPLGRVLVAGLAFSVGIEALQWLATKLVLAFPSRAVDINDVILNTLGVLLGIMGFAMVRAGIRAVRTSPRRPPTG